MAGSLNKCCFIGNMCKDPESRTTQSGITVVSFSIAVNEKFKDKETVEYIDVTAWQKLGEIIASYGHKGMQCYVEGRWTTDKFKDKDGNDRRAVKVTAERFLMLGGKGDGQRQSQGGGGSQQQYDGGGFDPDSDIPF